MEFRILGPLEVRNARTAVELGRVKPRAVLAVLLLHANEAVSAERLALALWGEDTPGGAFKTVQVHVSRLRKALGEPDVVETTPAGYRLRLRPGELDAERFAAGVVAGRGALAAGRADEASELLRDALASWRGPALADLATEPFAQADIARLEEQRVEALEARVEADLAAGRHAPLTGELRGLAAEHPTRERLAAQLMLALYRSGRQAEALEAYRDARARLVEAAGLEPGPELQRLQERILDQDPGLAPRPELPRDLDAADAPALVGRERELERLRAHWADARVGAGRLVTVYGPAGIGKRRLVAELAGEVYRAGGHVRRVPVGAVAAAVRAASGPLLLVVDADAVDDAPAGPELAALTGHDGPAGPALTGQDAPAGSELAALTGHDGPAGSALAVRTVGNDDAPAGSALAALTGDVARRPVLVVVMGRDLAAVPAHDAIALGPLDAVAVLAIARRAGPAEPGDAARLLAASGGVPRRVHEAVAGWVRREAERRVGSAAGRTAAGRAELRSLEAELAGSVVRLQAAAEVAEEDDGGVVVCPFKGLASFEVADAPYFFGRERLVAELVARLVGAPLLGVVGPSGSGKSSVVRAGLLPALADGVLPGSGGWRQLVVRPGEHPLHELARPQEASSGNGRLLLVVDQFEETFTTCREESERRAFVAELTRPREGRVVVLALRADHYGRCGAYPELSALLAPHHVLVGAMRRDELRRAVERPAQRVGLRVEPALVDALVGDVEREPGALPMLSTALVELWQRRDGRRLSLATYESTGGVRGAVARHAERAFGSLGAAQQEIARGVLLRLAAEGAGGGVERRRVALSELDLERDPDVARVVDLLADQRLLTVSAGAVEIAHEALLREWPRLRGWLEEDAHGRRLQRHLADAAREWDDRGREPGDLYRGARLAAALEWRAGHEPELNRTEQAFLDAAHDQAHAAQTRRRRLLGAGALALVLIAGISTVLAVRGIQRARLEERAAQSRNLATRATAQLGEDPSLAALLGLEAYHRESTVEARGAVLSALPAVGGARKSGPPLRHTGGVQAVEFSPDRRTLVSAGDDGTIRLWDVTTRRQIGTPLTGHVGEARDLAISEDGSVLASAGEDGTARLWDLATHRQIGRPIDGLTAQLMSVALSPDGRRLATGGSRDESTLGLGVERVPVGLWDVASGRPLGRPLSASSEAVNDLAFSPDGSRLAAAQGDAAVQVWDVATRRRVLRLVHPNADGVHALAFSPDGRSLATGTEFMTARVWDIAAEPPVGRPLAGVASWVFAIAFSHDGRTIAAVGEDGSVRLWNAATRAPRGVLVPGSARARDRRRVDSLLGVAFSAGDGLLASAGEQGAVQLWDLRPLRPLSRSLSGHDAWVRAVAFTPGGVASADAGGDVRLWDGGENRELARTGSALAMAASPDGRILATGGSDGSIRLLDARDRRPLGSPLQGHQGAVEGLAFSPDGDTLVSGSDDGTVRRWDVEDRRERGGPIAAGTEVNGVAVADGRVAAAGADGTVRLWDLDSGAAVGSPLSGASGFVEAVAFSPDGGTLASAGKDGSVWLWDVAQRRPLGPPLVGHSDVVDSVAFSPDGRTLASTGADHTVRLWDVETRQPLGAPLEGHDGWVSAVAFSRDGRSLASAGEDGTVRLWDPLLWSDDAEAFERYVCAAVGRSLSRREWLEFLPDRPYRATCR